MKVHIEEFAQNRTVQLIGAFLIFGLVLFFLTLGIKTNQQTTTTSTRADEATESVRISFDRTSVSTSPYEEVTLVLSAQPSTGTQQIQGYRFVLAFNPSDVQVVDMKYRLGRPSVELGNHSGNLTKANEDGQLIIQGEDQTAMGTTLTSATSNNIVEITFVVFSEGGGDIQLQEDAFNNVISIQNDGSLKAVPIVMGQMPTFTIKETDRDDDEAITDVAIDIKAKMQGIQSGLNVVVPLHLSAVDGAGKKVGTLLEMTNDVSGIWSGKATLSLRKNSSYKFLFQSSRHIATFICDEQPTETVPGGYVCPETGAIKVSGSSLSLDTSGILFLSGDLPEQDGVIDAQDITRVRNFLGRTDGEALYNADVNYDGIVDTQDHGLVVTSLERYKETYQGGVNIEQDETDTNDEAIETESETEDDEEAEEEETVSPSPSQSSSEGEDDSDYESTSDDTEGDVDLDSFFDDLESTDEEETEEEITETGSETEGDEDGEAVDLDSLQDSIGDQVDLSDFIDEGED